MAIGSTLRPELGRMDFSGIERGGRAAAAAIMSGGEKLSRAIEGLGSDAASVIRGYKEQEKKIKSISTISNAMDKAVSEMQEIGSPIPPSLKFMQNMTKNASEMMKGDDLNRREKAMVAETFPFVTQAVLNMYSQQQADPVYADYGKLRNFYENTGVTFDEKSRKWKLPDGQKVGAQQLFERYDGMSPELRRAITSMDNPSVVKTNGGGDFPVDMGDGGTYVRPALF